MTATRRSLRRTSTARGLAIACTAAAAISGYAGVRLLFRGHWLEAHEVRYGALVLIAAAPVLELLAAVFAVVALVRRPRAVASWVVAALPVGLRLLGPVLARTLGI